MNADTTQEAQADRWDGRREARQLSGKRIRGTLEEVPDLVFAEEPALRDVSCGRKD